jgi:L-arabinonolactonase
MWVALAQGGGIGRYSPDGAIVEMIDVPADFVASVAFGGEDGRDLYVATVGALLRTRAHVAGSPTYRARV